MLSFVCRNTLRMSMYKNVLVNEASPFDFLINDIPPKGLEGIVSNKLRINYLLKYQGSQEELLQTRKYKGAIVGDHHRPFFQFQPPFTKFQHHYKLIFQDTTMFTIFQTQVPHIQRQLMKPIPAQQERNNFFQLTILQDLYARSQISLFKSFHRTLISMTKIPPTTITMQIYWERTS